MKPEEEVFNSITDEDFSLILNSVKDFSKREIIPFLQNDLPDGDLTQMADVIEKLYELGIITYPQKESEGFEIGVWGVFTNDVGSKYSVKLLSEIAKTCGSTAFVVHNQGVAANIIHSLNLDLNIPLKKIAFALQDLSGLPYVGTFNNPAENKPAKIETSIIKVDDYYILNGNKTFVYKQKGTDRLLIPALFEGKWTLLIVPANAEGINYKDVGRRTGLRYLQLNHISFKNVKLNTGALIAKGQEALNLLKRAMVMNWLGISAIGKGIAEGSILAAEQYASERHQGGTLIENHGAIKTMFSNAYNKTKIANSIINNVSEIKPDFDTMLNSAQAKLVTLDECSKVVSDMMQVFGGYGYMQDYRMEKRLRDIQVLKLSSGSPIFLKKFIYDLIHEQQ